MLCHAHKTTSFGKNLFYYIILPNVCQYLFIIFFLLWFISCITEIFERADLQQIREFLLHGAECVEVSGETYSKLT